MAVEAGAGEQLPFRVAFDPERGQLVLMVTVGMPPRQRVTTQVICSAEDAACQVTLQRHEARLRGQLADMIAEAAVRHLGVDPHRLEAAVAALSDPASSVPASSILHGERGVDHPAPIGPPGL
ncbi:hypothetical protein [Streptomyces sp. NPDC026673]|uniref:hypothetical protein n=1 Tax=Streptomyces sp. NPDC026673 TaxID=3155724 RepID=UPI0033C8AA0E